MPFLKTDLDDKVELQRAATLQGKGCLQEAASIYRNILMNEPDNPGILHNLGVVLAQAGQPEEALALFDQVVAAHPDYVHAQVNRARALHTLGNLAETTAAYDRALTLQPRLYPVQQRQALALLEQSRRAEAMDHFAKTHNLRRDIKFAGRDHISFSQTTRLKIEHDIQQFVYLADKNVKPERFETLAALYKEALAEIAWPDEATAAIELPEVWRNKLSDSYNQPLHLALAPELPGSALSPSFNIPNEGADDIATLGHVTARHHQISRPRGGPVSVSECKLVSFTPASKSSSEGVERARRMMSRSPSSVRSTSDPSSTPASRASALGKRNPKLLPHFKILMTILHLRIYNDYTSDWKSSQAGPGAGCGVPDASD